MPQQVLAYDLGGTKVAVAVVDSKGKILEEIRVPVVIEEGKAAVISQLAEIGKTFLKKYPKIKTAGIASAGPVHAPSGMLLDPTNFVSKKHGAWGKVKLTALLEKKLSTPKSKIKVILENDAAAAILAEAWLGHAKNKNNAIILTLGTGLGTGIICNGALVRAGQGLHTEAGHLILNAYDKSAPCGCGNLGCAEAYLSGKNFTRRAQISLNDNTLDGATLAELARQGDPRARAAFDEYAEMMAIAIHNYIVIYAPELVIFTGSFAATSSLFIPNTTTHLEKLLNRRRDGIDMLPKLRVSKLHNKAGILGAAFIALRHRKEY